MHAFPQLDHNAAATEMCGGRSSSASRPRQRRRLILLAATLVMATAVPVDAQQQPGLTQGFGQATTNQQAPQAGPRTAQLIGLIQTSVAPDSWIPTAGPNAAGNGITPATEQLISTIQIHLHAATWSINGGMGTIVPVPF